MKARIRGSLFRAALFVQIAALAAAGSAHIAQPASPIYAYACDGTACYVLDARGQKLSTFSKGLNNPQGVATDPSGNVYITDTGNSRVVEYGPGFARVLRVLSDPGQLPVDVAISTTTNTIAVANSGFNLGTPGVSVYRGMATKPTAVLSGTKGGRELAVAFDYRGNCYLAELNSLGTVIVFSGCAGNPGLYSGPFSPNGVAFGDPRRLYFSAFQSSGPGIISVCTHQNACNTITSRILNPGVIKANAASDGFIVASLNSVAIYTVSEFGRSVRLFARLGATGVAFAVGPTY